MSLGNFPSSSIRFVGWTRSEIDTPCLCLDLAAFESNLKSVASRVSAAGKHWRPHAKCHKSPEIALRCLEQGAIGITCAKVSEAEVFASAGIKDLLIAHLPVGAGRVRRLAELCRSAAPIVTCDHYVQAAELSAECVRLGVRCRALVELNIGMNRTGVRPGRDARELAHGIQRLPGLQLVGIMGYEGHAMSLTDPIEKRDCIDAALGILSHARDLYRKNGLCCDIVSAGGTGSLQQALLCPALTEVQAGGAIFGDPYYLQMPDVQGLTSALTLLTTVVSRPSYDCAVLDAGLKAMTADKQMPIVKGWDDARIQRLSAEHTVLELGPSSRELRIGDQVELVVGYSDLTTMLHDEFLCFRGNRLEAVWPISARGKFI
ncbi:DSD1 family PLP-dependent enzyme [Schlesneria paludicola]|uniref:DSD1 family PLP-dependent enzyme n=1 Tax=Schlesneria paludicola TaxID=360056 RepID=UPI000299D94A|nr:DSD1 family PLP-dependent enzyme [Schlesneria paludicola]